MDYVPMVTELLNNKVKGTYNTYYILINSIIHFATKFFTFSDKWFTGQWEIKTRFIGTAYR